METPPEGIATLSRLLLQGTQGLIQRGDSRFSRGALVALSSTTALRRIHFSIFTALQLYIDLGR